MVFDFYYNKGTVTFETDLYPDFKAPQPFLDISYGMISRSGFWNIDVNWLMRIIDDAWLSMPAFQMADDDIHHIEYFRIFRFRGGIELFDVGAGKLDLAYNLLDWYDYDADKVERDEYRAGGIGFGIGLGHHWIMDKHFSSQIGVCYNWGFNGDAREFNDSSVADHYLTVEADCWYFVNDLVGVTAKAHWEKHDFEQLDLNGYPTEGPGTVTAFHLQLGLTLAITMW